MKSDNAERWMKGLVRICLYQVRKHPFVDVLERYMPDVKEKLNSGINITEIKRLEQICGEPLPDSFNALTSDDLKYIVRLDRLKELTIGKVSLDSIQELAHCKGLTRLKLYKVNGFDPNEIGDFSNITELELEEVSCDNLRFLHKLI